MKRKLNISGKIFNLSRNLYLKNIPILPNLLKMINRIVFSSEIPYTADIHPQAIFGHNGLGVVINYRASIGANTLIMQHVTIGGNMGKFRIVDNARISAPTIGNNVIIGAGAKILGPVTIGDYAQIGAGAVVNNDIPKNGVAVGIPARVIKVLSDEEAINAYSKI